ncbi:hypothetical protein K1X84_00555 [bacterium]|nr:hypothetical protein [bacterium]
MISIRNSFYVLLIPVYVLSAQDHGLKLLTAENHPMQYYVSLPNNWNTADTWPMVVVLEAAEKQYKENLIRFVDARGNMPFILVAPFIVTNGRQGLYNPEIFPYSTATWKRIDSAGTCTFDMEGLAAVMRDVRKQFHGDERFYITGFEAGAHLLWAYTFAHPQQLSGVAAVACNYIRRCVDEKINTIHSSEAHLPIRYFVGGTDTLWAAGKRLYGQWKEAEKTAGELGFKSVTEEVIPNKGHEPMPAEILKYFYDLYSKAILEKHD